VVPPGKRRARTGRRRTGAGQGTRLASEEAGGTDRVEGALEQYDPGIPQPKRTPGRDERGAAALDGRLGHQAEASRAWHLKWDDLPRSG
jgi:hypothetical protein